MSSVEARARLSGGASDDAVLGMVSRAVGTRSGDTLLDLGCGGGRLAAVLKDRFPRYLGVDTVRYEGFPETGEFHRADLDAGPVPLPDACADLVAAVETIEHLENPRAFLRELLRLARPGGRILVTTPNQTSLLSLATLVAKRRFSAFQDVHYPAHRTALLEVDLRRIAAECGLEDVEIHHSLQGRLIGTPWHLPGWLSRAFPGAFSDNLLMLARKP